MGPISRDGKLCSNKLQDLIEEYKLVSEDLDGSDGLRTIPMDMGGSGFKQKADFGRARGRGSSNGRGSEIPQQFKKAPFYQGPGMKFKSGSSFVPGQRGGRSFNMSWGSHGDHAGFLSFVSDRGEVENRIVEPPLAVDTPVGSRISLRYQNWTQLTLDRWVLEIVKKGHLIEYLELPKFNGLIETPLGVLLNEVQLLMHKNSIEYMAPEHEREGYY